MKKLLIFWLFFPLVALAQIPNEPDLDVKGNWGFRQFDNINQLNLYTPNCVPTSPQGANMSKFAYIRKINCWYRYDCKSLVWMRINWIVDIVGCVKPAFTPVNCDPTIALNGCGQIWIYDGTEWVLAGGKFLNGLTNSPSGLQNTTVWGGDLIRPTEIDGQSVYGVLFDSVLNFQARVNGGNTTSLLNLTSSLAGGASIRNSNAVRSTLLQLRSNGFDSYLRQDSASVSAVVSVNSSPSAMRPISAMLAAKSVLDSSTVEARTDGPYLKGVDLKSTQTHVLYWDTTTGKVVYGPIGNSGQSPLPEYDNDADAASFGLPLGGWYALSIKNTLGGSPGDHRQRKF